MAEEYVRTEVFEAYMARMEALQEKTMAEVRAENAQLRSDVNAKISELQAENVQLRKDMEAGFAQLRTEMQSGFALMNERMEKNFAEYKATTNEIQGEVRTVAARVNTLEFWGAFLIATATLCFAIAQYFQSKRGEGEKKVLQSRVAEAAEAGKGA